IPIGFLKQSSVFELRSRSECGQLMEPSSAASIGSVVWPRRLTWLVYDSNAPVNKASWPASLRHLSFGSAFNQPIAGTVWPASLQQLLFGSAFNQPIAGTVWPASLQQLSFGSAFNQPIADVVWP
ncbi:unnamed protein product, partial [Ectocarpus fasciculatus]